LRGNGEAAIQPTAYSPLTFNARRSLESHHLHISVLGLRCVGAVRFAVDVVIK
jgi:hypothetical protein